MTSATQSNSGASAYLGFLYALTGEKNVLTSDDLKKYDISKYSPAIVVMTDGMSIDDYDDFKDRYKEAGIDVPIFSIMYGSADDSQLKQLAELTNARVFDGRENLTEAFRKVNDCISYCWNSLFSCGLFRLRIPCNNFRCPCHWHVYWNGIRYEAS